jgi:hypothetical protein
MICYLVRYEFYLVFVVIDPRIDGCLDPIQDDVWLDDPRLIDPSGGWPPAGLCVGRNPADERHYRLFQSPADRARAGFHPVVGVPEVARSWDAFLRAIAACCEPLGCTNVSPESACT